MKVGLQSRCQVMIAVTTVDVEYSVTDQDALAMRGSIDDDDKEVGGKK